MSDEHDDVTEGAQGAPGDTDADRSAAETARPSGKRGARRGRALLAEPGGAVAPTSGGGTLTKTRPAAKPTVEKPRRNPFAAVWLYLLQVVAELRKVIWPNRRQMVVYTTVVLVFVVAVSAFVAGLDIGFAKLILWAFG